MDDGAKKRFDYKKLLLQISDRLSSENISGIKMLVKDTVPMTVLEKAIGGKELFAYFEERGLINEEKLGFLKEILDAINRQDLCEMINAFEDGGMTGPPKVPSGTATIPPVVLGEIAKEIGNDWKMLARRLGLTESDIQAIDKANMFDLHEASLQALMRWQDRFGDKANSQTLKRALSEMNFRRIIQKYF